MRTKIALPALSHPPPFLNHKIPKEGPKSRDVFSKNGRGHQYTIDINFQKFIQNTNNFHFVGIFLLFMFLGTPSPPQNDAVELRCYSCSTLARGKRTHSNIMA